MVDAQKNEQNAIDAKVGQDGKGITVKLRLECFLMTSLLPKTVQCGTLALRMRQLRDECQMRDLHHCPADLKGGDEESVVREHLHEDDLVQRNSS